MEGKLSRRGFIKLGALSALGAAAAAYPVLGAYRFEVNTYQVPVPNLPPEFQGFTIVHLTDLHHGFGFPIAIIDKVLKTVEGIGKDIVVCTGDYIHGGDSKKAIDTIWSRLTSLRAREGVYSVLGNHDNMWGNAEYSMARLEESGQSVHHRARAITRGKKRIWIGGAGEMWQDTPEIDKAFKDAPPDECKILLSHFPDPAETKFDTRVDLILSGHTHGGQIGVPHLTSNLSGLRVIGGQNVYISRGIGWYLVPVRINCAPEVSVLKLFAKSSG